MIDGDQRVKLTLRLSRAGRRRLRGAHRLAVVLVLRVSDGDSRVATIRRKLTLKR